MTSAVGVVVPAHDEEELLPRCLAALRKATANLAARPAPPRVHVVVVLARAVGMRHLLDLEAELVPERLWLATTDADSAVPPHWLTRQVDLAACGADAVVGTVDVHPEDGADRHLVRRWASRYMVGNPHPHAHGANLGVTAARYLAVGGFPPLPSGEDVAFVTALGQRGVARERDLAVRTSPRRHSRAPSGFAGTLAAI
ncbi:MAG: glycosyltransferase [Streptosporangiales bacterium]